nr:PREDICTED: jerky protein homolog-like [Megachile rotundata]
MESSICKPSNKKRKNVSILEKLKILKELNTVRSVRAVAEKYGIPIRTVRNWKKNESKLEEMENTYVLTNSVKRIRVSSLDQLDEALFIWFDRTIKSGITLTGPLVMAKALELHKDMGIETKFVASTGWLSRWKNKYSIRQYAACDEKRSTDPPETKFFKEEFESFVKDESTTEEELLNNSCDVDEYRDAEEDSVQSWIGPKGEDMNGRSNIPRNSELIAMVAQDNAEKNIENSNIPPENIEPTDIISAANTLLSFYERSDLLSASDLAGIRKAKQLAVEIANSK